MRRCACFLQVVAVSVVVTAFTASAVNVTIDETAEHQTIEGFGAHGSMSVWWSGGPFYNAQFLDRVVDDLGLTINRNEFYPDFEPQNENGDPNSLNYSAFNFDGIFMNKQRGWINALKNKAQSSGEPIRFITSYWSPPAWMKTNNSTKNGGNLKAEARPELAELAVATVRAYKEECGVDLYALSIQNEPAFVEPYNSCVYSAEQYRDAIKVVGPKLHSAYPNVKLFGAEDMLSRWTVEPYAGYCQQDPISREHLNVFAVHGYSDGQHPTPASDAVSKWKIAGNNCASAGKPLWMTETSGYDDSWSGAFELAEMIYAALKYGKIAAWVWWQLSENTSCSVYVFMYNGNPTKRYYIHKQYYRYIRPGAVMVDAASDNELVFSLAFHHKQNNTLTVVLINATNSSQTVNLAGNSLPTFNAYRTTSSDNCVSAGTVTNSINLAPSSVYTLYGTNYEPAVNAVNPTTGRVSLAGVTTLGSARIYTLDGKLVADVRDTRLVDGRVRWNGLDNRGTRAPMGTYYALFTDLSGTSHASRLPVEMH
ncbi:MAG: hypothetical protein GF331_18075 [Chitinivibrionales bacterium]|nr:hypothetical protein [Chitinivibrionales bacterium]